MFGPEIRHASGEWRRRGLFAFLAALMLVMVSACGGSDGSTATTVAPDDGADGTTAPAPDSTDAPAVEMIGSITPGIGQDPSGIPYVVAFRQGFFEDNGVEVERVAGFEFGAGSLEALIAGEVDTASAAEPPTVAGLAADGPFVVVGSHAASSNSDGIVVAEGIDSPDDLMGEDVTIGIAMGTNAEFWLAKYAEFHGLDYDQLNLVNVAPADQVAAMAAGDINVMAGFEPHLSAAIEAVDGAHLLAYTSDDDIYRTNMFSSFSSELAANKPLAEAVLQSLVDAVDWINESDENYEAMLVLVSEHFGVDVEALREPVSRFNYYFGFGSPEVTKLMDISAWMLANERFESEPDWPSALDLTIVTAVAPDRTDMSQDDL